MKANTIRRPDRITESHRAAVNQGRLKQNQEEWMMGLLLAAMVYFAAVAVCIRIVS